MLEKNDPYAYSLLVGMVQVAVEEGLDEEDNAAIYRGVNENSSYRTKIGRKAMKKLRQWPDPLEWLGELRIEHTDATTFFRSYFTDVQYVNGQGDDEVLFCILGKKEVEGRSTRQIQEKQDRQIVMAIDCARSWCRTNMQFRIRLCNTP
ncbi:hypothetical protein [Corynebacterium ulceribovis]|uniref:hypothetical protein n=1 Tax=Corynebacterium ulceribovis TaxID=487732 RepID=UPI0003A28565|nr:hypothetical protein [Corynebacterium ulceribovis]